MRRLATRGWIGPWTVVIGAVATLAVPGSGLTGQQRLELTRECRCVDDEGREIDGCACLRTPDLAWTTAARSENRARIGISVGSQPPTDEREGVRIVDVMEGGPADEAGLREGDRIARIDGKSLFEPLDDPQAEARLALDLSVPSQRLVALLSTLDPGDEVEIEYVRNGRRGTVTVTAERNPLRIVTGPTGWPEAPPRALLAPGARLGEESPQVYEDARRHFLLLSVDPCFRESSRPSGSSLFDRRCIDGVDLIELNPDLAEYFATESGVLVTDVHEESTLGLRPGDVILSIDGRDVTGPDHARRILESYQLDEDITFRIVRRGDATDVRGSRR